MTTINLGRVVGQDGAAGEDGRGITSITKTGTSGLIDTYTISYTDSTTSTFDVTNGEDGTDGKGIVSITKTSTSGLVDTYTILYTDGTSSTFEVTNGESGGGGSSNYNELSNKPSINNVTLEGNKTLSALGIQGELTSGTNIKTINNESILGSGNIEIEGGGEQGTSVDDITFENGIERDGDVVRLPKTNDVTFAIADSNGNSVFIVGNEGDIAFKLSDYLKRAIREIEPYTFDADVFMVPCVGQSLAINTGAGASTFSTTYPLSYNTNLENTNLQDMNTGFCEAFNVAATHYGVTIPANFKIITCVVGSGGTSINSFGKGSSHYNSVLSNIRTAKTACDSAGLKMIVPGFMWTQGEEDMRCGGTPSNYGSGQWDPFDYHTKLEDMVESYNEDIKAITGQTMDIHCFSYQTGSHNAYYRYPRIAMEQNLAATLDKRILLSKAMYDVNYNSDQVHCPAGTYRNMGNMYGLACFKYCVLQRNYHWVHPISFDHNGTELVITFDTTREPLVFDTTLVDNLTDGNYGFNIVNVPNETATSDTTLGISQSSTTIQSVEIISGNQIKITMSKVPADNDILTYGVDGDGWENITGYNITGTTPKSGHVDGARGCLRDSDTIINNNSGVTLPNLNNWCVIFEYKFGGNE